MKATNGLAVVFGIFFFRGIMACNPSHPSHREFMDGPLIITIPIGIILFLLFMRHITPKEKPMDKEIKDSFWATAAWFGFLVFVVLAALFFFQWGVDTTNEEMVLAPGDDSRAGAYWGKFLADNRVQDPELDNFVQVIMFYTAVAAVPWVIAVAMFCYYRSKRRKAIE